MQAPYFTCQPSLSPHPADSASRGEERWHLARDGDHRSRQQTRIRNGGFRMPGVGTRPYALARRGCGEGRRGGTARPRHPALRRKRAAALDEGALRSAAVHHRRLFAWRTLRAMGGKGDEALQRCGCRFAVAVDKALDGICCRQCLERTDSISQSRRPRGALPQPTDVPHRRLRTHGTPLARRALGQGTHHPGMDYRRSLRTGGGTHGTGFLMVHQQSLTNNIPIL